MTTLALILIGDSRQRIKSFHVESAKTGLSASMAFIEAEWQSSKSEGEPQTIIQQRVLERLRRFRYSNGEGYVAVVDDNGFMPMHPVHEHFDQKNIWDLQDPTGKFITRDAIRIAREEGTGINSYYFEHPITGELDIKTSAVGRFDPWGWTLIVGVFDGSVNSSVRDLQQHAIWVVGLFSFAFLCLAALIGRSLSIPIARLSDVMAAIAGGELERKIPYQKMRNETGAMARSLSVFRDSGRQIIELQKQSETAQKLLERERLKMTKRLLEDFGHVMTAVKRGDFSQRVATDLQDENLRTLAHNLNALVTTVDAGVDTVKSAMDGMVQGLPPQRNMQAFEGAFAEMLETVGKTSQTIKMQAETLELSALYDALTGLPNRRFFETRLEEIRADDSKELQYAVLHVDLDGFKEINDALGHGAGDEILQHVGASIKSLISEEDFVARIGGDEFVVIAKCSLTCGRAKTLAQKIVSTLSAPYQLNEGVARFGASVGIAFDAKKDSVLRDADLALYRAKRNGRGQVHVFSSELREEASKLKTVGDEIRRGLENGEFVAYYQPQVDARTLRTTGVEALARWQHPERGILPPFEFIPIAEQLGLMGEIDACVAEDATKFVAAHNRKSKMPIEKLALNISATRLLDANFAANIEQIDAPNFRLAFKLVETIAFDENADQVSARTSDLKSRGFEIEIDDFGTGRASMTGLLKISPDRIKIDRELVTPMFDGGPERQLVQMIVQIARVLKMELVAEGVETMAHADLLRRLGVETLQGYVFARPLDRDALIEYLEQSPLAQVS